MPLTPLHPCWTPDAPTPLHPTPLPVGVLGAWTWTQCGWVSSPPSTPMPPDTSYSPYQPPDTPYTPCCPQMPLTPYAPAIRSAGTLDWGPMCSGSQSTCHTNSPLTPPTSPAGTLTSLCPLLPLHLLPSPMSLP